MPRFVRSALRHTRRAGRRGRCTTVAVDTSGLLGRRAGPHRHQQHAGLLRELASRIRFRGPLTVAEYMGLALTHPEHGYYMRRDAFGRAGDFTTSPEVCQAFGELVGVWCVAAWEAQPRWTVTFRGRVNCRTQPSLESEAVTSFATGHVVTQA